VGATPVAGATNTTLALTNVSLSQNGTLYSVVVTNIVGSITSAPVALTVVDVSSPTIGYWRFENPGDLGLDSSGSGLELMNSGSSASASLPDSLSGSPGALFAKTIPLTSQTNINALSLDSLSYLFHSAYPSLQVGAQFTAEAFFNVSFVPPNTTLPLVSRWDNLNNQNGWVFAVREQTFGMGDLHLRAAVSQNGSSQVIVINSQRWVLAPGKDYYAAMTFNAGTITFYLADLSSTNPVLESETIVSSTVTNVFNTAADFRVGAYETSVTDTNSVSSFSYLPGLIDEVRVSRVALAPAALLYPPPAMPFIDLAPKDVVIAEHNNATFTITASGQQPLSYQWYVGATPITSATNTTLTLTNVSLAQNSNLYSIVVTNSVGSVTSTPALLTVVDVSSPTIGYWRFENPADIGLDSSGSGLELTNFGSSASVPLPDSLSGSPGALFAKTILLTGQTNMDALTLDGASYLARSGYPSFTVSTQFTAEAFFNLSSAPTNKSIPLVSHWSDYNSQNGWVFALREQTPGMGDLHLRLSVSQNGGSQVISTNAQSWVLSTNKDYYAAARFNAGTITFYLADLSSTNPVVQSETIVSSITNVYNNSSDFRVGAYQSDWANSNTFNIFTGLMDEVRVSRVALRGSQLLLPAPLPGVPAILTATASNAVVILAWAGATNASSYNVKRSLTNGGPYMLIASTSTLSFVDITAIGGVTNYYVVSAMGNGDESSDSSQANALPIAPATSPTILPVYWDSTGTNLLICTTTLSGHNYVLQSTPGLESPVVWTPVLTNAGTGGTITNPVAVSATDSKRFYRYSVQ
jgi:hypothetical protein